MASAEGNTFSFTTDDSLGLFPDLHYDQGAPTVHINTNFVHLVQRDGGGSNGQDTVSERVLEVCALCSFDVSPA